MAKFRLAVERPMGGTDFFDIVAWRRAAEFCRDFLRKGKLVLAEGRIQIRSFEDQTGQRRWVTEVVARNVQILDKSPVSGGQPVDIRQGDGESGPEPDEDFVDDADLASDLPF